LYKLDKNTTDVSYLNMAIKIDSDNIPEAHYIRGMIYYNDKKYRSAIEDFSKAIEADYCTEICYFKRGQCYSNLDKYDNAIADYTKAIELDPLKADNYYYRGGCYFCQQRYANALSDLNTAINLSQEESYYYVRALVYDSLDKYDKALADYKKVKELDPAYDEIDEQIQDTNRKLTLRLVKQ